MILNKQLLSIHMNFLARTNTSYNNTEIVLIYRQKLSANFEEFKIEINNHETFILKSLYMSYVI